MNRTNKTKPSQKSLNFGHIGTLTQLLTFILCMFCFQANAQKGGQCKTDLITSYQSLSDATKADAYEGIYMEYTIQNEYWETIPAQTQDITYIANLKTGKTMVQTNDHMIYIDKHMAVTIHHKKKLILITANPVDSKEDKLAGPFIKMRDSLIINSKVQECKSVVLNGQAYRQVNLQTAKTGRFNTNIQYLTFLLNEAKQIKKLTIEYTTQHQFKHITIIMNKTDYSYTGPVFNGTALKQVYTEKNTLKPEYSGYNVMNMIN